MGCIDRGIQQYRNECAKRSLSERPSTRRVMSEWIEPLVVGIEKARVEVESGKAMRGCYGWGVPFMVMDPGNLALLILHASFASLTWEEDISTTALVGMLGDNMEMEYQFLCLREQFPKLLAVMKRRVKTWKHQSVRRAASRMRELSDFGERWDRRQRRACGAKLLEILLTHTDLFEVVNRRGKNCKHNSNYVRLQPKWLDTINSMDREIEILTPLFQPMVIPPLRWAPNERGGYQFLSRYTDLLIHKPGQLEVADDHGAGVYDAINAIQSTPWAINTRVLSVMQQVWKVDGGYAGIPTRDPEPDFPRCPDNAPTMDIIERNRRAEERHRRNARMVSKRLVFLQTMDIAERYSKYDAFYYPHRFDFRGRAYPLPVFLQPQGNDVARGLLQFSEGKPLGKDGMRWLMIHYSNCWGMDKVSLKDRIAWSEDKLHDVIVHADFALEFHPLDVKHLWLDADDPWQALACLLDIVEAHASGQGHLHVSRLPVSVDGSNSGLQHFSAMLRDPHGASLVNLSPSPVPSDIYSDVAAWVKAAVERDAKSGLSRNLTTLGSMPTDWLREGIDRKLCKRGTMTYCYGVTQQGLKDSLIEDGYCDWSENQFAASRYIGKKIWEGIQLNITAAAEAMDWLRKCAVCANDAEVRLEWRTPMGFHVVHPYRKGTYERVVCLGSELHFLHFEEDDTVSKYKQHNSVAPNFVHSLDACHLMMVVLAAEVRGITALMLVHDNFGTHACDMTMLNIVLREQFIKLYKYDIMEDFRRQVWMQTGVKPPPVPEKGDFNLEEVRHSEYIFA